MNRISNEAFGATMRILSNYIVTRLSDPTEKSTAKKLLLQRRIPVMIVTHTEYSIKNQKMVTGENFGMPDGGPSSEMIAGDDLVDTTFVPRIA
jgi:hypothetical protein